MSRTVRRRPRQQKVAGLRPREVQGVGAQRADRRVRVVDPVSDRACRRAREPGAVRRKAQEPPLSTSTAIPATPGQLPSFNAYSADGDVTADLVYVNYGIPEDYEQLAKLGRRRQGQDRDRALRPELARIKPKVAGEHGAVGCIIYSDPQRRRLLSGRRVSGRRLATRAGRAARQRHGHADLSRRSADAGLGVGAGRRKLELERQSKTLLKIPVLPISYGDALPLLQQPRRDRSRRRPGAARCRSRITSAPVRRRCTSSWRSTGSERPLYRRHRAHRQARSFPTSGSSTAIITTPG